MKKILVSQSVYSDSKRKEHGDKLDGSIVTFLRVAGYIPIPVSNFHVNQNMSNWDTESLDLFLKGIDFDGLLLTGGNNIGAHENRDLTEKTLLSWALKNHLPALGLCRGMQLMGTLGGGFLQQVSNHVNNYHSISGIICDKVNSYHNLAFKTLPPEYSILAKSSDGVIEAFKHASNRWEGWMWHPERENEIRLNDVRRTRELFR